MEFLLHYTWRHRLFPLKELFTTDGELVEVIDVGLRNTDAGPDFFNAKLKIGGVLWVGNVEIHQRTSDWFVHKHHQNRAYDTVVLHVAEQDDGMPICRTDGGRIPLLVLPVPESVKLNYKQLMERECYPPCYDVIQTLPKLTTHSFLSALWIERLTQKGERIGELAEHVEQDWEQAFFITLARNFGFGVNGEAFQRWASLVPLRAVDKHRDSLMQVEALFFGVAGLLEEELPDDGYYSQLQREFRFLATKFDLERMDPVAWRCLRMRPSNFPYIRLAQLAYLYHRGQGLLGRLLDVTSMGEAEELFEVATSAYWEEHYRFGTGTGKKTKRMGTPSKRLLVINTLAPFLYAYGRYKSNEAWTDRAIALVESLPPEDNHIIRMWKACGLEVKNAADSQALIQLKRLYCDKKECLRCRFGYEYLKRKSIINR